MIDIHSHIIFQVDDGSSSIEESILILKKEAEIGVTDIICTPHYRHGMFETSLEKIKENFEALKEEVKKQGIPVNLYLGQEIYIRHLYSFDKYEKLNLIQSMNETNNYLLEFSYTENIDISEVAYNLKIAKKRAVIAHVERYHYCKEEEIQEIRNQGALIQVNASSVSGKDGFFVQKKVLKYIKHGLVDIVSSDIHFKRNNYMKEAYNVVLRKFGKEVTDKLFEENAKLLLN